ncbi:MAG: hypothetical protein RLZZ312_381 [Bacteroidota bacterium]
MNFLVANKSYLASKVNFFDDKLIVSLEAGREIAVPLEWFPKLRSATKEQLQNWKFIGKGHGIHWNDLDEDISVENLLS